MSRVSDRMKGIGDAHSDIAKEGPKNPELDLAATLQARLRAALEHGVPLRPAGLAPVASPDDREPK